MCGQDRFDILVSAPLQVRQTLTGCWLVRERSNPQMRRKDCKLGLHAERKPSAAGFQAILMLRMSSSGILRRVALVKTDVSEGRRDPSYIVPRSPILVTLMKEALPTSETSVRSTATRRNIPEDGILHSHRRGNLRSYIALTGWIL
jgi:hypothetical protein